MVSEADSTQTDGTAEHESTPALARLCRQLLQDVPIDFLVVYRVAFGLVMCWWAISNLRNGVPYNSYTSTPFHFTYYGFDWIQPPEIQLALGGVALDGMSLLFIAFAGLAICIAFGIGFRVAASLFAAGYSYWFMLDKAYYLNHYYLCMLLSLMLPFLPADRAFSFRTWFRPSDRRRTTPAWTLWLLRFQIGVPYAFGGLAKLNSDWLRGQPMRTTLSFMQDHPWVSRFPLDQEYLVQAICWGGLVFDLAIIPLLLIRRTRAFGFLLACGFHLTNHHLWNIGIFPWLMMAATTVYFDPAWPRQLLRFFRLSPRPPRDAPSPLVRIRWTQRLTVASVLLWVAMQVLIPLRVFVLPGNPSWSEYDHHFSWHMLLRAKVSGLRIYATDPEAGRSGTIDLRRYLTLRQLAVVGRDPRLIHQLCLFIADDLAKRGYPNTELRALALVSLNGRKPQPIIDPAVDLAKQPRNLQYPDWIMELYEPYRHEAWGYPLDEWEARLDLKLPPEMLAANRTPPASPPRSPSPGDEGSRTRELNSQKMVQTVE